MSSLLSKFLAMVVAVGWLACISDGGVVLEGEGGFRGGKVLVVGTWRHVFLKSQAS